MQPRLSPDGEFLVKDSISTNLIIGSILLTVFLLSMSMGDYGWPNYLDALGLFLIPGAIAIARSRRNATIIRINKSGLFYGEKLVSGWSHFCDAHLIDDPPVGSFNDHYFLDFRYYSPDQSLIYTKRIPLTNTQDKDIGDVMKAIKFYYDIYCANQIDASQIDAIPG